MKLLDAALYAIERPQEPGLSSRPVPVPVPAFIAPSAAPQYRLGQARVAMRVAAEVLRSLEDGQQNPVKVQIRTTVKTLEQLAESLEIEAAQARVAARGEQ